MSLSVHRSTCSLSVVLLVLVVLIDRCNVFFFVSFTILFSRKHRVLVWSNLKSFQLRNRYSEINSNTKLSGNITQKTANYYHYFFRFLTLKGQNTYQFLDSFKIPRESLVHEFNDDVKFKLIAQSILKVRKHILVCSHKYLQSVIQRIPDEKSHLCNVAMYSESALHICCCCDSIPALSSKRLLFQSDRRILIRQKRNFIIF